MVGGDGGDEVGMGAAFRRALRASAGRGGRERETATTETQRSEKDEGGRMSEKG